MKRGTVRNAFAIGLSLLLPLPALAEIYTWVDASGVTHFSSIRPAGQAATTYPTDPAFRTPAAAARSPAQAGAAESAEAQALRRRLETVESMLDDERGARVSDLKDQLESERSRVRRLESERPEWAGIGGLWSAPPFSPGNIWWGPPPGPVYLLPGHGPRFKPHRSGKVKLRR